MKAVGIFSVKGGVGKTLISLNLAHRLAQRGSTGLLDADWDNSNFAQFTNFGERVKVTKENRIVLPTWEGVKVFSPSLLFGRGKGISMTEDRYVQMISDVMEYGDWGNLDYMVVDLPGGSSDTWKGVLAIFGEVLVGDVIVTQPQMTDALEKGLQLHKFLDIPVVGVVNNMAYLTCPHGDKMYPFGNSLSTEEVVKRYEYDYFGEIPFITDLPKLIAEGKPFIESEAIDDIVRKVVELQVPKTSFLEKLRAKVTEAIKSEVEKVLAYFIITFQKEFNVGDVAVREGFTEQKHTALTVTDEAGQRVLTRLVLKLKDGKLVVLSKPEKVDFELVTSFKTLARMIMGKAKKNGELVDYDPMEAWLAGEVKAYGTGFTVKAVRTFEAMFSNQEVMSKIRERYGKILERWI
jgi:Mrp family chromosome partitioning ATPase/putative sterol carrier protein